MIREKRDTPIVIDLTGPQGNVFFLIAQAKKFAKQLNLGGDEWPIDNAVEVFDEYFGSFVILER